MTVPNPRDTMNSEKWDIQIRLILKNISSFQCVGWVERNEKTVVRVPNALQSE